MRLHTFIKNEEGFALAWVLIFFMIFSILSVSLFMISNQDLLEAKDNQSRLKAYYLAESGADLAYTALLKTLNASDTPHIDAYQKDRNKKYEESIPFGEDTIKIKIESVSIEGKWWVKVTSTATLAADNISQTTVLRVNVGMDNFIHVIREKK